MKFYLGTHEAQWLWTKQVDFPLFISARRLMLRKKFFQSTVDWALDSGGFSEIAIYGEWKTTPKEYSRNVSEWSGRIGRMKWAAIQDWMCEPFMIEKTGKSLQEHQELTIKSYLDLYSINNQICWVPVLQGWHIGDYISHVEQYAKAGINLSQFSTVGIGSVCRRQGTKEAEQIINELSLLGIKLHGFGFKFGGLIKCSDLLVSADSLAWSYNARRNNPLPGCKHLKCASCPKWATRWRKRLMQKIDESKKELTLF